MRSLGALILTISLLLPSVVSGDEIETTAVDTPKVIEVEGHLMASLGGQNYLFKTDDGVITVLIQPHIGLGRVITPRMTLVLTGYIIEGDEQVLKVTSLKRKEWW